MSRVFVWGKFSPFHLGHELLLSVATTFAQDGLFVFVSREAPKFKFEERAPAVRSFLKSFSVPYKVIEDNFRDPPTMDENGTCTDEAWWNEWTEYVHRELGLHYGFESVRPDDIVVSSDLYGAEIARRLGCRWIPVDPNRELVDMSGTAIRGNLMFRWPEISPHMRKLTAKRIAILGPESVGKSTMVDMMTQTFNLANVPEYGRTLYEYHPGGSDLTADWRWKSILQTQQRMIEFAAMHSMTPAILIDTEAIVTKNFWHKFSPDSFDQNLCDAYVYHNRIDHFILLAPTVPFVDDGTRLTENMDRMKIFEEMLEEVKKTDKPYTVVDSPDYELREDDVHEIISGILNDYCSTSYSRLHVASWS